MSYRVLWVLSPRAGPAWTLLPLGMYVRRFGVNSVPDIPFD